MRRALELAQRGSRTTTPNPRVGCVIVRDGKVVGEGWHRQAGQSHAEIEALGQAGDMARGADMYVNLEPCSHIGKTPPCTEAIVVAGIANVVAAMPDPNPQVSGGGFDRLRAAGINCQIGLQAEEAQWLNRGFVSRMTRRRPWLCLKTASSLDGKIALKGRPSKWVTSTASRREVHMLRAVNCAVLTSSNTAMADDPKLTARNVDAPRQPLRVLVDSKGKCSPNLVMLQNDHVVVATVCESPKQYPANVQILRLPARDERMDMRLLLETLAEKHQVNFLLVECGAQLAGSLLAEDLVDEIAAFIAPRYLGSGTTVAKFANLQRLDSEPEFKVRSLRQIGPDVLINLQRS